MPGQGRDDAAAFVRLLRRPDLPPGFERWQVVLAPRAARPADHGDWAGALVLVQRGRLEVHCAARGQHVFDAGSVLVLGWLPLRRLRNPGDEPVYLIAVRRRGERPPAGLLRVIRHVVS